VLVLDKIALEAPKTKLLVKLMADLNVQSALIVVPHRDDSLERAARNLPLVKVLRAEGANVYDLLRYEHAVFSKDAIEALTIFYSQPARRAAVTYDMIKQVLDRLKKDRPKLAPLRVWQAYAHLDAYKGANPTSELTALVALIRRACGIDQTIAPFSDTVRKNFQDWIMKRHSGAGAKFTDEQMDWLRMIRDHVINSFHIARDDLDLAPFDAQGGIGRMHLLFGEKMDDVIGELNEVLAA